MYLQQRRPNIYYHQRRISTNEQILAGNHFYGSCGDHCCGGGTLLLSYSPPGRKFRYVLFSSGIFEGRWRILAVFWCFCEALAVGLEPIWAKHASFFPTNRTGHWAPSTNLADRTDKNLGRRKTLMIIFHNFGHQALVKLLQVLIFTIPEVWTWVRNVTFIWRLPKASTDPGKSLRSEPIFASDHLR